MRSERGKAGSSRGMDVEGEEEMSLPRYQDRQQQKNIINIETCEEINSRVNLWFFEH